MIPGFEIIEKDLIRDIKGKLDRAGIFYRIFNRIKDSHSIEEKVSRKGYYSENKKMQDIFGIRVITYFSDDVKILYSFLKEYLEFVDEQIDVPSLTEFKPKRTNLIFRLNKDLESIFKETLDSLHYDFCSLLDSTFELQLRTIFSEGWHEIDHSLRYKCRENWNDLEEQERFFNGIFASLEISDSILMKLFDEMSYNHYKAKNFDSLIRTKFRLKFGTSTQNKDLRTYIKSDDNLQREIFKLERNEVVTHFLRNQYSYPLTIDSFIFFINRYWIKDSKILDLTPTVLKEDL